MWLIPRYFAVEIRFFHAVSDMLSARSPAESPLVFAREWNASKMSLLREELGKSMCPAACPAPGCHG
jgi:hypothetical protein